MEKQITYVQIENGNTKHYIKAQRLCVPFIHELNLHEGTHQTDKQILEGLQKRIAI